jgi:outer membrane protein OmpA-like peptidoglycan-associated protein
VKQFASRLVATCSVAASVAFLSVSCSLLPQRPIEHEKGMQQVQRTPLQHIAQLDFGRNASFAVCTEPACPVVSRKTLAVAPAPAAPPLPVAVAPRAPARHQVIVQFMTGSAKLTPSGRAILDQALPTMRKATRIVISGRTDSTGGFDPNQTLALARALNVRDYLRRLTPSLAAAMVTEAKGRCCFIASNDTPQGRRQNRRVEVVFHVSEQVAP